MKKIVLTSLMMVCLPYWAMSQSVDDDLYFIPKKKAEKKEEVKQEVKVVVPQKQNTTTVYAAPRFYSGGEGCERKGSRCG